jgi:predicted HD phosphohydrolase
MTTILDVAGLLRERGARRYGESVTQLAHALQCAALARASGADDDLVLAALLHDIGHLAGTDRASDPAHEEAREIPTRHHGRQGARLIAPYVPERVAWVVEHHVIAKRYLCTVEPSYEASLSPVSRFSLLAQGGPLPVHECRIFERARWFEDAVAVRRWDEAAKDPAAVTAPLEHYLPLLARYSLA